MRRLAAGAESSPPPAAALHRTHQRCEKVDVQLVLPSRDHGAVSPHQSLHTSRRHLDEANQVTVESIARKKQSPQERSIDLSIIVARTQRAGHPAATSSEKKASAQGLTPGANLADRKSPLPSPLFEADVIFLLHLYIRHATRKHATCRVQAHSPHPPPSRRGAAARPAHPRSPSCPESWF